MPVLNDWIVELQFNDSKVERGIKDLDRKFAKLNSTDNRIQKQKVDSEARLARQRIKDRLNLHRIDVRLAKDAARERARADRNAARQQTRLQPLTFEGRQRQESAILRSSATAAGALSLLGNRGDADSVRLRRELTRETERLAAAQKRLAQTTFRNTDKYRGLARAVADSKRRVAELSRESRMLNKQFRAGQFASDGFRQSLRNLARSYLSVFAVIGAAAGIGRVVTDLESINASLLAATGSAEEAARSFEFISTTAFTLGTDLRAGAKGYQQIGTAGRAAGLSIQQTNDLFLAAQEGAVAFGLSTEDQQGVLRAFTQILGKGNVKLCVLVKKFISKHCFNCWKLPLRFA